MATPAEEKLMIAEPVEVPKWPDTRYLRSLEGIVRMITLVRNSDVVNLDFAARYRLSRR